MNDLDKIKDLLGSEDSINRELGIVLALSQGMSLDELVDKCYNKKWYKSSWRNTFKYFDTSLGKYSLTEYPTFKQNIGCYINGRCTIIESIESDQSSWSFRRLIVIFLQDNYPELLNKINNK